MVREVLRYPDPRLKERAAPAAAEPAAAEPAAHDRIAADLIDTMRAFPRCVGVAAPQIGSPLRVCVVDCTDHPKAPDASGLLVLVDPVLTLGSETEIGREGCLSIPDLTANVRRALTVTVAAAGIDPFQARGFEARAIQHEVDHLDGILFLDRVVSAADVFARKSRG